MKKKSRSRGFKPQRVATGIFYTLTTLSVALLTALLLGIVLSDDVQKWMFYALVIDILFVIWLIYTRKFTTSETIAWRTRN